MYNDQFEGAFDDFLDAREFEDAEEAFFQLIRAAFAAGWVAAGGAPPDACPMVDVSKWDKVIPFVPRRRKKD